MENKLNKSYLALKKDLTYYNLNNKLSDYLINELYYCYVNNSKIYRIRLLYAIKLKLYFIKENILSIYRNSKSLKFKYDVFFCINSISHLEVLYPLLVKLDKTHISFLIISTKKNILNNKLITRFNSYYIPPDISLISYFKSLLINNLIKKTIEFEKYKIAKIERTYQKLLKFFKPKLLFSGNDLLVDLRIPVILANELKINTFCIQHGTMSASFNIFKELVVKEYIVWGENAKNNIEKVNKNIKIKVLGNPGKNKIINKKISMFDKNYFLVMLSGYGNATSYEHYINLLKSINIISASFPELLFIVKTHPKESYDLIKSNLKSFNIRIYNNKDLINIGLSTEELINNCSALISGNSTSVLTAMFLDKPTFTIDLINEYSYFDFISSNSTIHSKTTDEAISNISEFIRGNLKFENIKINSENFITNEILYYDDEATENLYSEIKLYL